MKNKRADKIIKEEERIKLVIDGNLLARKNFYKFRNLSSSVSVSDLSIICSDSMFRDTSKDQEYKKEETEEYIDENSGKKIKINYSDPISKKIKKIKNKSIKVNVNTGILYGVLRSLISIKEKFPIIKDVVFCFDPPYVDLELNPEVEVEDLLSFRKKEYNLYKNRTKDLETEREFSKGIYLLHNFLYKAGFTQIRSSKFEADDILHYLTHKIYRNSKVYVLTSDHDLKQVLNKRVSLLEIGKNFGLTTEDDFIKKYGFKPDRYREALSLSGCTTDNVPGVKGIGEDTALSLIKSFNSVKNILSIIESGKKEEIEKIPSRPLNSLLKDRKKGYKSLLLSRKLVSLYGLSPELESDLYIQKANLSSEKSFLFANKSLQILNFKSFLNNKPLDILEEIISEQKDVDINRYK